MNEQEEVKREHLSRRSFIKRALAGAAGITAASVLAPVAMLAESKEIYTPGTYSATAKGLPSDVTVTMTFDEESSLDVKIDVSGETPDRVAGLSENMAAQIINAQTGDGLADSLHVKIECQQKAAPLCCSPV